MTSPFLNLLMPMALLLLSPILAKAELEHKLTVLSLQFVQRDGTSRLVPAITRRPPSEKPLSAVVVVTDAFGLDQRVSELAELLSGEGWATLELDLYPVSADGYLSAGQGPPTDKAGAWPGAIALVELLTPIAEQLWIDPDRIAVVGLGLGGRMALLSGAEALKAPMGPYGLRYAAHAAFYPGCGALSEEGYGRAVPWSTSPTGLFLAGRDSRDRPGACEALRREVHDAGHAPTLWVDYPHATYGWDLGVTVQGRSIRLPLPGGGRIEARPNPEVSFDAAWRLVAFLHAALDPPATR
jgi:dienelactone hydrolase